MNTHNALPLAPVRQPIVDEMPELVDEMRCPTSPIKKLHDELRCRDALPLAPVQPIVDEMPELVNALPLAPQRTAISISAPCDPMPDLVDLDGHDERPAARYTAGDAW
jgi:hypothetical protein